MHVPPHAESKAQPIKAYKPRHPERTLLNRTVTEHFSTWSDLSSAGQFDDQGGRHYPVALSCKGRGVCPSCNTRRRAKAAAHLTDHVFPRLRGRQWVLSVPKDLRYDLQRDKSALIAALRIFCARSAVGAAKLAVRVPRCGSG